MKNTFLIVSVGLVVLISSCKKSNSYDNHSSPLMQSMHKMSADMAAMSMTMDPDHDFAAMMKRHHEGALDMVTYELANGTDGTIKMMAQAMKDAQTKEVSTLDSFIAAHSPSGNSEPFMAAANKAMKEMDSSADAQKLNGNSDHDFAHLMIQHHQSAIDMANAEILYGQNMFIKNMAQMMIADQTEEIAQLQSWLNSGKD